MILLIEALQFLLAKLGLLQKQRHVKCVWPALGQWGATASHNFQGTGKPCTPLLVPPEVVQHSSNGDYEMFCLNFSLLNLLCIFFLLFEWHFTAPRTLVCLVLTLLGLSDYSCVMSFLIPFFFIYPLGFLLWLFLLVRFLFHLTSLAWNVWVQMSPYFPQAVTGAFVSLSSGLIHQHPNGCLSFRIWASVVRLKDANVPTCCHSGLLYQSREDMQINFDLGSWQRQKFDPTSTVYR